MSPPAKSHGERERHERSPLGQAFVAGASAYGAYCCHQLGLSGNDLASIGAIGLGLYSALSAGRWLKACQIARDRHLHARRLESFHANKGNAHIGTANDARAAGLLGTAGFPCGRLGGHAMRKRVVSTLAITGPPGCGKSNLLVEWLLTNEVGDGVDPRTGDPDGRLISFIVSDPSLELFAVSASRQRQLGRCPLLLGPGAAERAAKLGITERTHGIEPQVATCNPFSWLRVGPTMLEDVEAAALRWHPGVSIEKAGGNQRHFDSRTRELLSLGILAQLAAEGKVTCEGVRRRLLQPLDQFQEWLELMSGTDFAGGELARTAAGVLALLKQSPEEFSGGYTQARDIVRPYAASSQLGSCTRDGIDLEKIKDQPLAIYLTASLANPEAVHPWMNLMFGTLFDAVARSGDGRKVAAVLEEAPSLGPLSGAARAVTTLRKAGLITIWCSQDLTGQYQSVYGRDTARTITSLFETVITFAVRDGQHAKQISDRAGEETIPDGAMQVHYDAEGIASKTYTGNYAAKPVIRPSEVMTLPKRQSIVVSENLPTFLTEHRPYYQTSLRRYARPNPYYNTK